MFSQFGSPNHKVCMLLPSYSTKVPAKSLGLHLRIGFVQEGTSDPAGRTGTTSRSPNRSAKPCARFP